MTGAKYVVLPPEAREAALALAARLARTTRTLLLTVRPDDAPPPPTVTVQHFLHARLAEAECTLDERPSVLEAAFAAGVRFVVVLHPSDEERTPPPPRVAELRLPLGDGESPEDLVPDLEALAAEWLVPSGRFKMLIVRIEPALPDPVEDTPGLE